MLPAAGRGGRDGVGTEDAVAGHRAGPAGVGTRSRQPWLFCCLFGFAPVLFGAGFAVQALWRVAPAALVLWLLGFVI